MKSRLALWFCVLTTLSQSQAEGSCVRSMWIWMIAEYESRCWTIQARKRPTVEAC